MNKFFIRLSNSHEVILKYTLVLTTVILIVIALPKENRFNYSFRKGKPWPYENLMAPVDFAINKTEAELNEERAQVLKNAHPFYRLDANIGERKIQLFQTELTEPWLGRVAVQPKLSKKIKDDAEAVCINLLREVYETGIILLSDQPLAQ